MGEHIKATHKHDMRNMKEKKCVGIKNQWMPFTFTLNANNIEFNEYGKITLSQFRSLCDIYNRNWLCFQYKLGSGMMLGKSFLHTKCGLVELFICVVYLDKLLSQCSW